MNQKKGWIFHIYACLHKGTPKMHFYGYTWNVMAVMGKYQGYYGAIFFNQHYGIWVSENVVYPQLWQFD